MYEGSHKDIGYGVSKAAVINLSKYLAVHLAPNIRVNCVIPGGVEHKQEKKFVREYSKHTPLNRMMRKDELNHKNIAYDNGASKEGLYFILDKIIKTGSKIAINISEKI